MITIREEEAGDAAAIRRVVQEAFGGSRKRIWLMRSERMENSSFRW